MKLSRPAKSADGGNFAANYDWNLVIVAVRISPAELCACISRLAIKPVKGGGTGKTVARTHACTNARTHVLYQRQL